MPRKKYDVPAEVFCRVWQLAESADQVAEQLKMPKSIVLARASFYRKSGVKLKKCTRRRAGVDVAGLNAMLGSLDAAASPESVGKTRRRKSSGEQESQPE